MTQKEAIALIDNIIADIRLNRAQHARLLEAIGILYDLVQKNEKSEHG